MNLRQSEKDALKAAGGNPIFVFRFSRVNAEAANAYAYGVDKMFTVQAIARVSQTEMANAWEKRWCRELVNRPPRAESGFVLQIIAGDWTDTPRYMQFTGSVGGDYANSRTKRVMKGEPEPITEEELTAMAAETAQANEAMRESRRLKLKRQRHVLGFLWR